MYYAYVLKSEVTDKHYYGYSSNLAARLKEHNYGKVRSTKAYKPWKLVYREELSTKSEAYQ